MDNNISISSTKDYASIIKECFLQDKELLNNWHIEAGKDHLVCVQRTINDIKNFDKSFEFFVVKDKEKNIGFFGIEFGNFLSTLFLLPEYRNSKYISQFWLEIQKRLFKPFYSALYSKNKPCSEFFLKNGATIIKKDYYKDNLYYLFEFKE